MQCNAIHNNKHHLLIVKQIMSMLQMSALVLIFVVQIFAVCRANNSRPTLCMISFDQAASRLSSLILVSVRKSV